MRKSISEILEEASKASTNEDKIRILRANDSFALRVVLQYALDPNIKWLLPKGKVPYKPSDYPDAHGVLYKEARRLYLFVEGGNPNLKQPRREYLYIELLESVDKKDAELLVAIKDKKIPYKGINYKLVKEAFPEILPDVEVKEVA